MAKQEEAKVVKLQIPAGQANPSPPVGPALGQAGVNIMEFCKAFNDKTKDLKPGLKVPVIITVNPKDRSFTFITKKPPAAVLIKEETGKAKGSATPNREKIGTITKEQLEKVATLKMDDLNTDDLNQAVKIIAGSAKSMGFIIEEGAIA